MAPVRALAWVLAIAAAALVTAAGAAAPDRADRADPAGGAAAVERDADWKTYVDPDRGTAVEYPAALFSVAAGAPERGSGREFRTEDGRARLIVYTLPNEERRSPRSYLQRHLLIAPGALEYTRVTRQFFAISGVRDADVFYSRCNFPQRRRGDMRCILLQYPERETKAWDAIVTRISLSLREESLSAGMASSERSGIGRHWRRR
jgi:hypothetical protein